MSIDADGPEVTEIPVGTPSDRERAALDRARKVSTLLDDAVRVPGTDFRIGIDPIVSVLPVGGDALGLLMSAYIVVEALLLGVPKRLLARMVFNIVLDFAGGSVPVLGTLFDAYWKANERNVELLERHVGAA